MVLHLVPPDTALTCHLVSQGVPLIHVRSDALTIGNGKSHGPGVASTAEQNIVGLPASQPISRCFPLTCLMDKSLVVQGNGLVLPWHSDECIVMSAGSPRPACPESTYHLLLAICTMLCPYIISLLSASGIL